MSHIFLAQNILPSLGIIAWASSAGAMGNKTLFAGKLTFVDVTFVLFVDTNLRLAKSIANARQNVTKITSTYNRHIILSKISICLHPKLYGPRMVLYWIRAIVTMSQCIP